MIVKNDPHHFDNFFFAKALALTEASNRETSESRHCTSWSISLEARIYFIADAILSAILFPLALIATAVTSVGALFTWKWEESLCQFLAHKTLEKLNRIFTSLLGIFSVNAANAIKDFPLTGLLACVIGCACIEAVLESVVIMNSTHVGTLYMSNGSWGSLYVPNYY